PAPSAGLRPDAWALGGRRPLRPAGRSAARLLAAPRRQPRSSVAVRLGLDPARPGSVRLPSFGSRERSLLVPRRGGRRDERDLPGALALRRHAPALARLGAGGGRAPRRLLEPSPYGL